MKVAISKKKKMTNVDENVEKLESLHTFHGNVIGAAAVENGMTIIQKHYK